MVLSCFIIATLNLRWFRWKFRHLVGEIDEPHPWWANLHMFFHWGEGKIKTYENLVVYDMGFYHVLPKKYIGLYRVFLLGEVSFIHIIHIWDRILLWFAQHAWSLHRVKSRMSKIHGLNVHFIGWNPTFFDWILHGDVVDPITRFTLW